MSDGTTKAQCKFCFHFLSARSNSTLKAHINNKYCETLKSVPEAGQSSMARDGGIFVYNLDVVREQFVGLAIQEALSFNHFDNPWMTRVFQNHLQQKYNHRTIAFKDFSVPHTGVTLFKMLKKVFIKFHLEEKIISIALDDASNNTKAIGRLQLKYGPPMDNAKEWFNKSLEGLYNIYFLKYGNPTQSTSVASSSRSNSWSPMTQLLNRLRENSNKRVKNDRLASNKYERYVTTDFISYIPTEQFGTFDALGFWKAKEQDFRVLSRDILNVQASSIASEFAFSTSGRVLSIRRTRLTPASLEMCMCLKDHLDATDRILHTTNLENTIDFEEVIFEEEVLANEAMSLSDEENRTR
nr:zinc finger BED domain-containing protein RICESLEEPER 2 [Tanacetum cinerariifolium]